MPESKQKRDKEKDPTKTSRYDGYLHGCSTAAGAATWKELLSIVAAEENGGKHTRKMSTNRLSALLRSMEVRVTRKMLANRFALTQALHQKICENEYPEFEGTPPTPLQAEASQDNQIQPPATVVAGVGSRIGGVASTSANTPGSTAAPEDLAAWNCESDDQRLEWKERLHQVLKCTEEQSVGIMSKERLLAVLCGAGIVTPKSTPRATLVALLEVALGNGKVLPRCDVHASVAVRLTVAGHANAARLATPGASRVAGGGVASTSGNTPGSTAAPEDLAAWNCESDDQRVEWKERLHQALKCTSQRSEGFMSKERLVAVLCGAGIVATKSTPRKTLVTLLEVALGNGKVLPRCDVHASVAVRLTVAGHANAARRAPGTSAPSAAPLSFLIPEMPSVLKESDVQVVLHAANALGVPIVGVQATRDEWRCIRSRFTRTQKVRPSVLQQMWEQPVMSLKLEPAARRLQLAVRSFHLEEETIDWKECGCCTRSGVTQGVVLGTAEGVFRPGWMNTQKDLYLDSEGTMQWGAVPSTATVTYADTCRFCREKMSKKNQLPTFCEAAGFGHGMPVPQELQGLSMAEEGLISRIQPVTACKVLKYGQRALLSQAFFVDRMESVMEVASVLPRLAAEVEVLVLKRQVSCAHTCSCLMLGRQV
jgi:hypothetical protein